MAKQNLSKNSYRVSGTTDDGVAILTPRTAPKHFTSEQIKRTISKVVRNSESGRFMDADPPRDRKR